MNLSRTPCVCVDGEVVEVLVVGSCEEIGVDGEVVEVLVAGSCGETGVDGEVVEG